MKVATRIGAGTLLLLAVLLLALAYYQALVRELAAASERLSTTAFAAFEIALRLARDRGRVEELTLRFWVRREADYPASIARRQLDFEDNLGDLEALQLSPVEAVVVGELRRRWQRYREAWDAALARWEGEAVLPPVDGLLGLLEAVRDQLAQVGTTTEQQIALLRAEVDRQRLHAERISRFTALGALALSLPIVVLTLRSILRPLRRLLDGTRAVASGDFETRLETSGRDELTELAASFNNMVERLGELDRLKSDFLSHVSHELRTPLASIRETTDALLEELAGPLTDQQQRLLELNQHGAERLSRMLTRLLDLARLEAGAVEYDLLPHDLAALARESVEAQGGLPERRGRFELVLAAEPVMVRCDRERFRQVIDNLLANADKYSPAGEPITVRVERDGRSAQLAVEDLGPGVPDADKGRIFEKFHQARGPARPGFGLGLAICREIVAAHGGALWVEDHQPRGSRFCVRLALSEVAAA